MFLTIIPQKKRKMKINDFHIIRKSCKMINDSKAKKEENGMDYTWHIDSPLGGITLASDGEALVGLWFDGQKYFAAALAPAHESKYLPVFKETERWLDIYFGGKEPDFTPPLALRGTAFQKAIWDILLFIPYGGTMTYGEIARRTGITRISARAVGGAVGRNPVSLIVPCHRVVGADGSRGRNRAQALPAGNGARLRRRRRWGKPFFGGQRMVSPRPPSKKAIKESKHSRYSFYNKSLFLFTVFLGA